MQIQAADIRVGDVIQESGYRGKIIRRPVEVVRRGGHIGRSGLSSTPIRLVPYASIVVNEEWVYPWSALVTVLRDGGRIEEVGSGG